MERAAVPVAEVLDPAEPCPAQERVDLRRRAEPERGRLPAGGLAAAPLEPFPADAGHGVEAPADPDLCPVWQRPAIAFGVVRDDVIAVHALEQQCTAGPEYAARLAECGQVVVIVQE